MITPFPVLHLDKGMAAASVTFVSPLSAGVSERNTYVIRSNWQIETVGGPGLVWTTSRRGGCTRIGVQYAL